LNRLQDGGSEEIMRNALPVVFVLLLCFGLGWAQREGKTQSPAGSASNPCDKANSQREMNQCSWDEYGKADAHLNAIYRKIMASLQKNLADAQKVNDAQQKSAEMEIENLKAAEKAWIGYRDLHCAAAKQLYDGGSIVPTVYANCMQLLTNHRIEELKATYETPDQKLE
jgi:uncharacterized protein YecT (DUF1311 family)